MARGSSWFKAKRAKLIKQLQALPKVPPTHQTIAAANAKRDEVNTLVAYGFNGAVVQCPRGANALPVGKARREFDKRTYGNFKRLGAALTAECYAPAGEITIVRRAE